MTAIQQAFATTQVLRHAQGIGSELHLAIRAALAAGKVVTAGYGKLNTVQQKDLGDLVSEVDCEADRVATEVLKSESDLPILSEELNCDLGPVDNMWIVDPLDGSTAYLMQAGREYPAVLVARREEAEVTIGVAYFPLTGDWYYAQRGRGAWRNAKRVICDSDESLADVWVELNQYGNGQWETPFFASLRKRLRSHQGAQLVTTQVPHSGVAMRIAGGEDALAVAVHDNNPQHVKQAAWDVAAPQVIMEEAGGVFLNPEGNRADPFAAEPIIVARSRGLADELLALVPSQLADS